MRIFLLATLLISCGTIQSADPSVDMPEEIEGYYREFFSLVDPNYRNSGTIEFAPILPPRLGQCSSNGRKPWTITLNTLYWPALSDEARRSLVFHELTHCTFFSMDHSLDPHNYMYPNQVVPEEDVLARQVVSYTRRLR